MNKNLALEIVGGLSSPSKMPCYSFSIPASRCKVGKKLRKVKNSICSICYALKGRYGFGVVQKALERRFANLKHPKWVEAMAWLVNNVEKSGYFRWHDSGDLQSVDHLKNIIEVCKQTAHVKHWLPTREYGVVGEFIRSGGTLPENLIVRFSALMIDGEPPVQAAKNLGVYVSSARKVDYTCPASKQNNTCGDCRHCWDKNVFDVSYKKH
jgi:hypothetical protein